MSTQPSEKRLHRKIKEVENKLGYANRKVVTLKRYINELEEMIFVNVDPTGFEGRDAVISQDINTRANA